MSKTKLIETLTPEQAQQVAKWHKRLFDIGTCTDRADRPRAEAAISEFYSIVGRNNPKFVWCESPKEATTKYGVEYPWFVGQMDIYWIGFYMFPRDVLGVKYGKDESRKLYLHGEVAESCGWWWPYENAVLICERPVEIHMIKNSITSSKFPNPVDVPNMVLHRDGGMAVRYSDGFGSWNLNGVRVPKEIAETPGEKLDPALMLREKNAEIRREIVRKIGIERIVKKLGAEVVDKQGEYELLMLDLKDGRKREFLKMKNPSIATIHIEGVPPGTKTVAEALAFRNGRPDAPATLT